MKKRLLAIVAIGVAIGTVTFLRVQYRALMCNVSRADANGVAALATTLAALMYALGVVSMALAYSYGIFKNFKGRLIAIIVYIIAGAMLGMTMFNNAQNKMMMLVREYVRVDMFKEVSASATVYVLIALTLGVCSVWLIHRIGIFKHQKE